MFTFVLGGFLGIIAGALGGYIAGRARGTYLLARKGIEAVRGAAEVARSLAERADRIGGIAERVAERVTPAERFPDPFGSDGW